MPEPYKISIINEGGAKTDQIGNVEATPMTGDPVLDMPISDSGANNFINVTPILKYASYAFLAKEALQLAQKLYMRVYNIEHQNRSVNEALRNYGGQAFSENTIGDTYNIFTKRTAGESVAYHK